ncbi:MAG: DUF192 domain-containing protein [Phycisphaerales bacterium]|nr:DUF192 domain-containing protein [Phycisphaerales bacterium]
MLITALLPIAGCRHASPVQSEQLNSLSSSEDTGQFMVKGQSFKPDIARDDATRARGLQNRQPPADGLILLFPFKAKHSIWMPNCPADLEAWVIDDQGTILEFMQLPAQPPQGDDERTWQYHNRLPRHRAKHEAMILWEFKAGTAEELGIVPGDRITGNWPAILGNQQ